MGRFVMDIIQRIAQLESEQIGERVYIGMVTTAFITGASSGIGASLSIALAKKGHRPDVSCLQPGILVIPAWS